MKQLKKTIEVQPQDELVNTNCPIQSIGSCPMLTCICDGGFGNSSIEDEDEIIF
jgi:hypothetical protein